MAIQRITLADFFSSHAQVPMLDVRSPAEFAHAHIPGALSLPLFNNEQRAEVGTTYKQRSREKAIKLGLDYFGPNMRNMLEQAELYIANHYGYPAAQTPQPKPAVLVHCWRGGMRSAAVAWLLDLYGFTVYTLEGGYKSYRRWALDYVNQPLPIRILGGFTGSAKTDLLQQLATVGEPIIDLEALALHRGSAFGAWPNQTQPSQEMFENKLAMALLRVRQKLQPGQFVWMEDESQRIGNTGIPAGLWQQMRLAPVLVRQVSFETRLQYILEGYGQLNTETIIHAIVRITKRLGPLETKTALQHIVEKDIPGCFRILLTYYDKQYRKSLAQRVAGGSRRFDIPENIQEPQQIRDYVASLFA